MVLALFSNASSSWTLFFNSITWPSGPHLPCFHTSVLQNAFSSLRPPPHLQIKGFFHCFSGFLSVQAASSVASYVFLLHIKQTSVVALTTLHRSNLCGETIFLKCFLESPGHWFSILSSSSPVVLTVFLIPGISVKLPHCALLGGQCEQDR